MNEGEHMVFDLDERFSALVLNWHVKVRKQLRTVEASTIQKRADEKNNIGRKMNEQQVAKRPAEGPEVPSRPLSDSKYGYT